MRAKHYCVLTTAESREKIQPVKYIYPYPGGGGGGGGGGASAAVLPKVVVLFLLIHCLLLLPLYVGVLSLFCNAVLFVYANSKYPDKTLSFQVN